MSVVMLETNSKKKIMTDVRNVIWLSPDKYKRKAFRYRAILVGNGQMGNGVIHLTEESHAYLRDVLAGRVVHVDD